MKNINQRFNNIRVMHEYLKYENDSLHKTKAIVVVMYQTLIKLKMTNLRIKIK